LNEQLNTTDAYLKLLSEVQKLQHDFGKRLRKLAAASIPKKKTGPEDATVNVAFGALAQQLSNMGAVMEAGAKDLNEQVLTGLKSFYDSDKRELENKRNDSAKLANNVDQLRKQLETAWQKYVTAFKEKQKAYDNWIKAEGDLQLPRIEQQKDGAMVIDKLRSDDLPPVDLPFLNLGTCPSTLFDGPYQSLGAYLLGLENPKSCPQISAFGSGSSTALSSASGTMGMLGGAKRGNLRTAFICDIGVRGVKMHLDCIMVSLCLIYYLITFLGVMFDIFKVFPNVFTETFKWN
uniref:BAR domain-containing protein n=1 Tax=Echinostoma caproni TaxID=27848 RepID=A0A183AEZ1_9TREM